MSLQMNKDGVILTKCIQCGNMFDVEKSWKDNRKSVKDAMSIFGRTKFCCTKCMKAWEKANKK